MPQKADAKPKQHFRILEFWRLAAALLVMIFHFVEYGTGAALVLGDLLHRLLPLMEMFFMISGFLIMLRYSDTLLAQPGSYRSFLVRRVARLYPLYLVTLLFFVAVGLAVQLGIVTSSDPARYDFVVLPANILLVQGWGFTDILTFNYVGWTLSAEWFCYLALPVFVVAFQFGGKTGLVLLAAVTIGLLELGSRSGLVPFDNWMTTDTWGAYRAFADFGLGALLAVAVRDSKLQLRSHLPAWLVFGGAVLAMMTLQNGYFVLALLGLSVFLAALAERNNPRGSEFLIPFGGVGKVSFGIYLIHPVVGTVAFALLWRKFIEPLDMISFAVYLALSLPLVVGLALLSARYFEAPVSRLIVGYHDRRWAGSRRPIPQFG